MSGPSVAELREVAQPAGHLERRNGEHWAGVLYMRRLSPYLTRLLLRTPLTANGVTWLALVSGLLAYRVARFRGLNVDNGEIGGLGHDRRVHPQPQLLGGGLAVGP